MVNETLFSGRATVTQVAAGKLKKYAVQLYDGYDNLLFSRNVQVPRNNGNHSPSDVALAVFQDFLKQGYYNRLSDRERKALAEYWAEAQNPETTETAHRRLSFSHGLDLEEMLSFNITLLKRDTSGRIKILF